VNATAHPPTWKIMSAFATIYFVWGSTFLAIRVGVLAMPPLLFAAMRFLTAGILLFGWMLIRGERTPRGREWMSVALLSFLIFLCDYGLLFWAEQRVPSGIAAVMMATIPAFIAVGEILLLRTQKFTIGLVAALLMGIAGVAVLMSTSVSMGGAPVDKIGAAALIVASVTWSLASVISRKLQLPPAKAMSSGAQMLLGGIMLSVAAIASGELRSFKPGNVSPAAWFSLLYLIAFGSILGFTAYVWLLHHESPTKVGTYAYVNPVVAVVCGFFLGGEALGLRTIVGTVFILLSVLLITTKSKPVEKRVTILAEE